MTDTESQGLSHCDKLNLTTMNYRTHKLTEHIIYVLKYILKEP
jgi:hypothetical protein